MSTERADLVSEFSNDISVTSFFSGSDRGGCIQLTQSLDAGIQFVQLDKEQAMQLAADITRWVSGE